MMQHARSTIGLVAVVAAIVCAAWSPLALATPLGSTATSTTPAATPDPLSSISPTSPAGEAAQRVIALEREVADLEAEASALDVRLNVMQVQLQEQGLALDASRARVDAAQKAYEDRIVAMYKSGEDDLLTLVFTAVTFDDFISRTLIASRIAEADRQAIESARWTSAQLAYAQAELEGLRAEQVGLRTIQRDRVDRSRAALAEARALVLTLTARQKTVVEQVRVQDAKTRKEWQLSSIPLDAVIPKTACVVDPYTGIAYLCADYQPKHYRATGQQFTAVCSWYGPGFNGRRAASGQTYNMNDFTCASRTLPFGTRLALTRAGRNIVVVVTDRGPYVDGRDLDLSFAAAESLGFSGVEQVEAEVVVTVDNERP